MNEFKRITAQDIIDIRTQKVHPALEFAEMSAKAVKPFGGPQAFAERQSERREKEPWRKFVNDLDGRITAICYSFANNEQEVAKQQLTNYFTDRIGHAKSGTYEGKSRWIPDELAIHLATEMFAEEKLMRLVIKFYDAQRKAEEKYDKKRKKELEKSRKSE